MVGIGFLMVVIGVWSLIMRFSGRLYEPSLLHRSAVAMGPMGFVAVLAGWITTEMGRQPYTVYGLLKTVELRFTTRCASSVGIAHRFCGRVFRRVWRRHLLSAANDGQAARKRRARPTGRQTDSFSWDNANPATENPRRCPT